MLSTTKKLALTLIAAMALGMAQDKPADPPKKEAKDQAEADLINGIMKDGDPAHRLKDLDKWMHDYPETAFGSERKQLYFVTYTQLNRCKDSSKSAAEILKTNPNHELALRVIIGCVWQLKPAEPGELDTGEQASNYLIAHADAIYATKPADNSMTPKQWEDLKPQMLLLAKRTIPYIDLQRKDDAKAEADLTKLLQADGSDAQASFMLAGLLFGQRVAKPTNQPPAIFEYARAGVYDGPNSLPATNRPAILSTANKYYKSYHGSDEGWDKVVALAKTNALPPADFAIDDMNAVALKQQQAKQLADAADPVGTVWRTIHEGLTGDNDTMFWESVKDAGLPGEGRKFKGKLVSMKPAIGSPKTLVIAVNDPAGDVTLSLETPLRGKMDAGAELEFEGTATAYKKAPFMLTLTVDDNKTKIVGWKPVAAPPTVQKKTGAATAKKKAE